MNTEKINSLRRRFVKDFNLPINIVDEPFFNYYMSYYDFFPREDYYNLLSIIEKEYSDNIELWLMHYSQKRDEIITTIENSKAYKYFNEYDLRGEINAFKNITVPDINIYNMSNIDKYFISIDMKKANFQALKSFDKEIVLGCDSYEELIDKFGGDEYFKKSKYTRQVIFGKLNPKRTIQYENYLIRMIYDSNLQSMKALRDRLKLVTIKSDELVFEVTDNKPEDIKEGFLNTVKKDIKDKFNIDVEIKLFRMGYIETVNHNGNKVDGYIRHFLYGDKKSDLKGVSTIFFPQIYAFSKGYVNTEENLYFRAEDQTAKFIHPLELIRII